MSFSVLKLLMYSILYYILREHSKALDSLNQYTQTSVSVSPVKIKYMKSEVNLCHLQLEK